MVTIDDVLAVARPLPRSTEVVVHGRLKFRVGKIVYLAFSRDETVMGFGFPKAWRAVLVDAEPDKFMLPDTSDMRFNWLLARLATLEKTEMRELVLDAWRMVVPKYVAAEYEGKAYTAMPGSGRDLRGGTQHTRLRISSSDQPSRG